MPRAGTAGGPDAPSPGEEGEGTILDLGDDGAGGSTVAAGVRRDAVVAEGQDLSGARDRAGADVVDHLHVGDPDDGARAARLDAMRDVVGDGGLAQVDLGGAPGGRLGR